MAGETDFNRSHIRPQYIYVAGPYPPPGSDQEAQNTENLQKADEAGKTIANKRHIPFIPHKMMSGWEESLQEWDFSAKKIREGWLDKCDALFFEQGTTDQAAEADLRYARENNLQIYYRLEDIPTATPEATTTLTPEAREAYLTEYVEAMESYRDTYRTIWQVAGFFGALSAAIIAFGPNTLGIQALVPVPLLFWWLGIFVPMDRYGQLRRVRLSDIEERLNSGVPDLDMAHYREFNRSSGIGEGVSLNESSWWHVRLYHRFFYREYRPPWRVKGFVYFFGIGILVAQIYLLYVYVESLYPG